MVPIVKHIIVSKLLFRFTKGATFLMIPSHKLVMDIPAWKFKGDVNERILVI